MLSQTSGNGSPTSIHQFHCWAQHPLVWNIPLGSCPAVSIPNSLCPPSHCGTEWETGKALTLCKLSQNIPMFSTLFSAQTQTTAPCQLLWRELPKTSTNAQQQIIQWPSSCCLQQAIEEEGGDPDEIPVGSELTTKRMPKRTSKGTVSGYLLFAWH